MQAVNKKALTAVEHASLAVRPVSAGVTGVVDVVRVHPSARFVNPG